MTVEIKNFQGAFDNLSEGVKLCQEQIAAGQPGHFEHMSGNLLLPIPPLLAQGEITIAQAGAYVAKYRKLSGDSHVILKKVDKRWKIVRTD